jgi:predicted 3-demethylubiquinone-9 3-methyltransferase (glyoxalase superfamily)
MADFYCKLIPNSRVVNDTPASIELSLAGQPLLLLKHGRSDGLSEAFSLVLLCDTQAEIDHLWAVLTHDGSESRCGWCTDRYGLNWQIVPRGLSEWLQDADVLQRMLTMQKLDIDRLLHGD